MDSKIDSQHPELLPICTTVGYTVNLLPQGVDPFDLSTMRYMGTRYQLKVEQKEVTQEKREEFSTNIKAKYQGAIGGFVSVDVKKSEAYKQYTS
ncbi:hypothetical protein BHYA_0132g00220 [Botrytis hyacinthi]|uniref:Uncharacterized protein n=1 Tax=Botrytis hyacinthi TaxID=278943 RepID=A0A4Z1GRD9_9HELO|nr:hypothetical protein BHYA_0132g00220 [Botrytis hyacinthi]